MNPPRAQFRDFLPIVFILFALTIVSVISFVYFSANGLGLAYNDARSHLDIGRRVVEGLKPGLAQIGSVWLPLPHILMTLTIWNDFMWHSGLSGAIISMISYVTTGTFIYLYLRELNVGKWGQLIAIFIFAVNANILYLQSTAMTELLLIMTMTAATYHLLLWFKWDSIVHLIGAGFWIMLSTLVRYDGWFLFILTCALVCIYTLWKKGYKESEGKLVLIVTLGGFGIFLWLLWNLLIFKDPLYFAFGPYSAHTQQDQLEAAGVLATKGNFLFSVKVYLYAMAYNVGIINLIVGGMGALFLWSNKFLSYKDRLATVALLSPILFNILALYLGHSVLFIEGLSGTTWFNVRYGIMIIPSVAIWIGYLIDKIHLWSKVPVTVILICMSFYSLMYEEGVTIKDAKYGSSQKNVTEVSGWLKNNVPRERGFVLISAASHDAIIFSSTLPMKRFIHEGTGAYWDNAVKAPDRWARWIVMRTYSDDDLTYRLVKDSGALNKYEKVVTYPFADIYQLKSEYSAQLNTEPVLGKQK